MSLISFVMNGNNYIADYMTHFGQDISIISVFLTFRMTLLLIMTSVNSPKNHDDNIHEIARKKNNCDGQRM